MSDRKDASSLSVSVTTVELVDAVMGREGDLEHKLIFAPSPVGTGPNDEGPLSGPFEGVFKSRTVSDDLRLRLGRDGLCRPARRPTDRPTTSQREAGSRTA
jgi:hypothetical protein